jgi:ketosteroid isomerase-like protein
MRFFLRFACVVIVTARIAGAQSLRPDSAAAVSAVDQFHAALAAGDSARAVSLLGEDLYVMEAGTIETRADYLAHHLGADMKASQGSKGERTVLKVTVVGDAAYVVAKTVTPPAAAGGTPSESAELMVLSRTSGTWRIRAVHWSSRRRRA